MSVREMATLGESVRVTATTYGHVFPNLEGRVVGLLVEVSPFSYAVAAGTACEEMLTHRLVVVPLPGQVLEVKLPTATQVGTD